MPLNLFKPKKWLNSAEGNLFLSAASALAASPPGPGRSPSRWRRSSSEALLPLPPRGKSKDDTEIRCAVFEGDETKHGVESVFLLFFCSLFFSGTPLKVQL